VAARSSDLEVFFAREGQEISLVEGQAAEAAVRSTPSAIPPARGRILIVDDDPNTYASLKAVFEDDEYTLQTTASGTDGLARLRSLPVDLVLLDANLPDMDGYTVLSNLRELEHLQDLPVIMLTDAKSEGATVQGFDAGATDYVTKPFSPSQLRARVSGWLRRATNEAAVS